VTFEQRGAPQWVSRAVAVVGVAFVAAFASVSSGGLSDDWLVGLAVPGFLLWVFGLLLSLRPSTASVRVEADQVVVEGWVGDLVPRPSRSSLPLRGLRVGWSRLGGRSANEEVLKLTPAEGPPVVLTGLKSANRSLHQLADAVHAAERAAERREAGEPEPAAGIRPPSRIPEGT
jgi:hypothetical protein